MKVVSPKKVLVSEDWLSIKRFSIIVMLSSVVIGLVFTLGRVDFGDFTLVVSGFLTALTGIIIKIIEKWYGTSEYVGSK